MLATTLVTIFATLSYSFGIAAVFRGNYRPSIYSRFIWLLLAINSFVGVIALQNNTGSIILSGVQAAGSVAMLVGAWKYSIRTFGIVEKVCTGLLVLSGAVWLLADSPFINVAISLVAHFIGAIPTLIACYKKPAAENFFFWFFFAIASIIALVTADKSHIQYYAYALYFTFLDSVMTLLSGRQFLGQNNTSRR